MIAFMWTALFGMAVLAVDFGYLYTKRRGLQSAADSATIAAMPIYKNQGIGAAQTRALNVADANGYRDGIDSTTVQVTQPAAGELEVAITRTYPTFFGGVLGFGSKTMTGRARGRLTGGSGGVAIHANDRAAGCSAQWTWGVGVTTTGGGRLVVNGDVEAQDKVELMSSDVTCTPATCKVTGTVSSPCAIYNNSPGALGIASTAATPTPDPLAANTLATLGTFCTGGTSTATALGAIGWDTNFGPGCDRIQPGVYCSNADINVVPPVNNSICPSQASFISAGRVNIMGDGAITISAAPGVPDNIIAYSDYSGAGNAMQLSNGALLGQFTLNGSMYAPRGNINLGTGTPGFSMTGSLVGDTVMIAMGPGQPWVFTAPSGGSGVGWSMIK